MKTNHLPSLQVCKALYKGLQTCKGEFPPATFTLIASLCKKIVDLKLKNLVFMKKQLLLFLALTIYSSIFAQNLQWVKRFGDTGGDLSRSVAVDASGNVYTTGEFTGIVDFDPSASVYTLTTVSGSPIGNSNCYVSKLDAAGNFIWAKNITSSVSGSSPKSIVIDPLGNLYITGWFYNTVDFDPGASVYNLTSNGLEDIFISKLNSSGNFVWAKSIGSANADYVYSMAVDANSNVITTGTFRGTGDFDPSAAAYNLASAGADDIFISKLDIAGNFVWAKSIGDLTGDNSRGICVDATGNIYVTGSFSGTVDFDPGIPVYNLSGAISTSTDFYLLKLDASGSFIFAKNLGADIAQGASIERDAFGNIYVSGYFQNTVDFDPGASVYNLTGIPGQWDVFNLKLNASGNFIWANQINGTATQLGDIDLDAAGNFFITGVFSNTVDFDPSGSVFNLSATGASQDIFLCKLDVSGNFVWAKQFDGASSSTAYSMEVDALNNIYVTGLFDNTVDFDPNVGVFNLTSNGSYDAYILKLGVPCAITSTLVAKSNVSCFGLSNGSATISVSGGASPYTYSWSPIGGTTTIGSSLSANTYTCYITDNNLCTAIQTVTISQPSVLSSSISSQKNVQCNATSTGSLALSVSGGTGSYTYSWAPSGGSGSTLLNQPAGNYTCTIQDVNLCSITQTASLTQPSAIVSSITSQTNVSCNGGFNGSALINASGGTGTLTYTWQPTGGSSTSASSLSAGNYTCTISDANSCVKQQTVSITQPSSVSTTISSLNNIACFGNQNGSATIIASGGTGSYTYSWSPSSVGTSSTATNLGAGTYTCLITDINSCNTSTTLTITEPSAISSTVTATSTSCTDSNDGNAVLIISGGMSPYTIAWNNGSNTLQNSNLIAGTYSATISDANLCTYTVSVLVQNSTVSCFFVPNGFSPNGDGINDTWEIPGINNYPNAQVTVLNRWGQEMLNTNNYTTPWDGSFKGGLLPTSDYYYIINLNDGSKALTGTLTIKR